MITFVIYKTDKTWTIESKNGTKIEKSTHTNLTRGLRTFFNRHPGTQLFYITIPELDSKAVEIARA